MHGNSLEGASNQSECHQANRELEGHRTLSSSAFITSHAKSNRSLHRARSQQDKPSPSPHPKPKGRAIEMHNYIYNDIYICIRYCSYKHSTFRLHHQPCQVQQKPDALNLQPTFSHKPSTYLNLPKAAINLKNYRPEREITVPSTNKNEINSLTHSFIHILQMVQKLVMLL